MSPEEQLAYIGTLLYFVPPATILAVVARRFHRSPAWAAFAILGWLGLAIGLLLLLLTRNPTTGQSRHD